MKYIQNCWALVLTFYDLGERIRSVLAGPIIFSTNLIYMVIDDN